MRYYEDNSITKKDKRDLKRLEDLITSQRMSASEMFLQFGNISVIPVEFILNWLDMVNSINKYEEAKIRLTYFDLNEADRKKYETQLRSFQAVEQFIPKNTNPIHQADPLSMKILRHACIDVVGLDGDALCVRSNGFIPEIDTIRDIEKRLDINLIQYELSPLGNLQKCELLNKVDKAERLINEDTIIPLPVYCEFLNLVQLLAANRVLEEMTGLISTKVRNKKRIHSDVKTLSKTFDEKFKLWIRIYPFLTGKPIHDLDRLLLEHYTRTPSEIIEMFGPDVVCFPYEVPEEMKNSPFDSSRN